MTKCENAMTEMTQLASVRPHMCWQHLSYASVAYHHGYTAPMTRDEILKLTHLVSCAG